MKIPNFAWKTALLASSFLLAQHAHAKSDYKAAEGTSVESAADVSTSTDPTMEFNNFFGGQAGAGILSSSGGTHLNFGLAVGRKLISGFPNFIAGFFYDHISRGSISSQDDPTALNVDSNLNFYGIEGDYILSQMLPGAQVGFKLALGNNSISVSGVDSSSTDLYLGPKVAYDVGVGGGLTAGFEGNILFATGTDSRTTTSILGTLKYWLG